MSGNSKRIKRFPEFHFVFVFVFHFFQWILSPSSDILVTEKKGGVEEAGAGGTNIAWRAC